MAASDSPLAAGNSCWTTTTRLRPRPRTTTTGPASPSGRRGRDPDRLHRVRHRRTASLDPPQTGIETMRPRTEQHSDLLGVSYETPEPAPDRVRVHPSPRDHLRAGLALHETSVQRPADHLSQVPPPKKRHRRQKDRRDQAQRRTVPGEAAPQQPHPGPSKTDAEQTPTAATDPPRTRCSCNRPPPASFRLGPRLPLPSSRELSPRSIRRTRYPAKDEGEGPDARTRRSPPCPPALPTARKNPSPATAIKTKDASAIPTLKTDGAQHIRREVHTR